MSGTTGIVAFDYQTWALRYPEFTGSVSQALATLYFNEACLYLDNTPQSVVSDLGSRALYLNMLTAHIAALNAPGSSPLVGRISSASEGSVNVSVENGPPSGTATWFQQTKYGSAFYAATAAYRTFRYRVPFQPFAQSPAVLPGANPATYLEV